MNHRHKDILETCFRLPKYTCVRFLLAEPRRLLWLCRHRPQKKYPDTLFA
jgi:hypothetical protein